MSRRTHKLQKERRFFKSIEARLDAKLDDQTQKPQCQVLTRDRVESQMRLQRRKKTYGKNDVADR